MRIAIAAGILISLTVACSNVCAQPMPDEGPLGMKWGSKSSELKNDGVELKEVEGSDFGVTFALSKLNKALSDQMGTFASFGYNDKLWRIAIISKSFPEDPTGTSVRERYRDLTTTLSEKYGKPHQVHQMGDSIFSEQKNFISGISAGRTNWYSNFETPTLFIQIGVIADNLSDAKWRIIYENKIFRKDFDASKKAKEKGAL